ncbi:hypothetical protein DFH27DRAFT_96740 [Peziza echinospora]|nr:hypothetical protein DFH27DRAFT_96740 [Peziza echinospora]
MKASFRFLSKLVLLLPFLALALAETSPSDGDSVICHGDLCYPKEFVPTAEFQTIHEDQSIPPGLHIRVNMATGLREGKINVPGEGEEYEGVVVELPSVPAGVDEGDLEGLSAPGAIAAAKAKAEEEDNTDGWGAVKPPISAPAEQLTFTDSVAIVLDSSAFSATALDQALSTLEPLVHEIYWGLKLAVPKTVVALLNIIQTSPTPSLRSSAALVLGGAISNNPKALKSAITTTKPEDEVRLIESLLASLKMEKDDVARARIMYALSQGVKSTRTYNDFLQANGLELLRELWDVSSTDGGEFRGKASTFVEDNFLNEDMRVEEAAEPSPSASPSSKSSKKKQPEQKQKPIVNTSAKPLPYPGLNSFCEAFQTALIKSTPDSTTDDAKSKILNALVALRKTLTTNGKSHCVLTPAFTSWYTEQLPAAETSTGTLEDNGEWFKILAVELKNEILSNPAPSSSSSL